MARSAAVKKTVKSTVRKAKAKRVVEEANDNKPINARAAFFARQLDEVERKTRMPSNTLRYLDPLSSGMLQLDRALSGGWHNLFASISGAEGSGKTTAMYHGMANALALPNLSYCLHIEPERTLNAEFVGNVFAQFNLNYRDLMDDKTSPLRYYPRQVIEQVFDLMHATLKKMPDKVWVPETQSWGYVIPKRDKYWAAYMDGMGLQPDKKLATEHDYICPTEYSGIEGAVFLDSLAAMLTENDDESETRSKVRAAEASAFSLHLKRVVSRVGNKGIVFPAVNQLRKVPGQTYGDPLYEPGGEAIKFYSGQRLRIAPRQPPSHSKVIKDKDVTNQYLEKSVHKDGAWDRYKYKFFKNTKNKVGFPGLTGYMRVWVADAFGAVRGFDPVFDASEFLRDTAQIKMLGRKKGETLYAFKLRESLGRKRSAMFNGLKPFSMHTFKKLILAEVEDNSKLWKEAGEALNISPAYLRRGGLRAALFAQIRMDRSILQVKTREIKEDDDSDDVEEL